MKPYYLGLYEKAMPNTLSLEQKLIETAKAGYDFLELSVDESDEKLARLDWSNDEICKVLQLQARIGVPILSLCLSGHRRFPLGDPDEAIRRLGMSIMEKAIQLAKGLGVRIIQLAGYDVYYKESNEETRTYFTRNLIRAVDLSAKSGVILAFETMETNFMDTIEKAMLWVNKVQSPWLQIYPDLGNITNAAGGCTSVVTTDLKYGRGHLVAMHLKESKPGVFRNLAYGEGHVDFLNGARVAFDLGVRLFVGEFWHIEGDDNWPETLSDNATFLHEVLRSIVDN